MGTDRAYSAGGVAGLAQRLTSRSLSPAVAESLTGGMLTGFGGIGRRLSAALDQLRTS